MGELDDLAASRGAAACAIELARERAVLEAEDRLQTDLVEALVTGLVRVGRRGRDAGRAARLRPERAVLRGRLRPAEPAAAAPRAARTPGIGAAAARRAGARGRARALRAPIGARGDRVVAARAAPGRVGRGRWPRSCGPPCSAEVEEPVSAGVGRAYPGVEGIRQSYERGRRRPDARDAHPRAGQVAQFAELGLYRLLLALRSTTELDNFYQDTLGTLAEYDRKNDGELVKTLDAYFACLGSPTEAAERLHVHRNTLLYRLHRIQEIAGIDLSDAETRLALHCRCASAKCCGPAGRGRPSRRVAQGPGRLISCRIAHSWPAKRAARIGRNRGSQ